MEIRPGAEIINAQERPSEVKAPSREEDNTSTKEKEVTYSKNDIDKELTHLNKWLESQNSHLHFVLHDRLHEYYVQVVNDRTNEVIKEIPSKKMMDLVANLYEKIGIIMDHKV